MCVCVRVCVCVCVFNSAYIAYTLTTHKGKITDKGIIETQAPAVMQDMNERRQTVQLPQTVLATHVHKQNSLCILYIMHHTHYVMCTRHQLTECRK